MLQHLPEILAGLFGIILIGIGLFCYFNPQYQEKKEIDEIEDDFQR